jgi:hypothetical protein
VRVPADAIEGEFPRVEVQVLRITMSSLEMACYDAGRPGRARHPGLADRGGGQQDIAETSRLLQKDAAKKRGEVAKLQREVRADSQRLQKYFLQLYRLVKATKAELGVQQGHGWASGEQLRLEGNKVWEKASKSAAEAAGVKEGACLRWSREKEAWVPKSKERALKKRGRCYDEEEQAWLHRDARDGSTRKKTSREGKDTWQVLGAGRREMPG